MKIKMERARQLTVGFGLCAGLALVLAGCHKSSASAAEQNGDPAAANLAQGQSDQYASQQQGQDYTQQAPAPIERAYAGGQPGYSDNGQGYQPYDDQAYDSDNLVDWQTSDAPPPLPEYDQPPDPDPDYIWTPGYWAWGPGGYYWVPGYWVAPPYVGALWTPGYWAFFGGGYRFHHGYWGRHIGFYGGINYGFGYFGIGYEGGYWNGNHFYYNTRVTRVNVNVVRNVYVHDVTESRGAGRVSFNGGRGGVQVRPRPAESVAMREQRIGPMQSQSQVQREASQNRQQFYSANRGRPAATAAAQPVARDRTLPAELPRAAGPAPRGGGGGGAGRNGAQPGQIQRGGPENVPRGGSAPEAARPGQQGRPGFQPGAQEARPVQPQNEARPQQTPDGNPQGGRQRGLNQGRPQTQAVPQQQAPQLQQRVEPQQQQVRPPVQAQPQATPNVQRGQGRPDFQRPQAAPQPQSRPQEQMRQQGPPQRQAAPQAQHTPPQQPHQQAAPPAAHGGGDHGQGHGDDKHGDDKHN